MPACGWGVRIELPPDKDDPLQRMRYEIRPCGADASVMYVAWARPNNALSGGGVKSALYLCEPHDPNRTINGNET